MGLQSQGMLLAASDEEGNLSLLTVDKDIKEGCNSLRILFACPMPLSNSPSLPVPSVKIPDINLQPVRSAGISVLDALRLESNSDPISVLREKGFA